MIEQATVTLTSEALSQLRLLVEKEANPQIALRVFVSGGGCSGLQNGMAFDDEVRMTRCHFVRGWLVIGRGAANRCGSARE